VTLIRVDAWFEIVSTLFEIKHGKLTIHTPENETSYFNSVFTVSIIRAD
jgi:hypothetical protein